MNVQLTDLQPLIAIVERTKLKIQIMKKNTSNSRDPKSKTLSNKQNHPSRWSQTSTITNT